MTTVTHYFIKHSSGFFYTENILALRMVDCFTSMSIHKATPFISRELALKFIDEKMKMFTRGFFSLEELAVEL